MRFQWRLLLSARGSATHGCGRQRLCCGRWVLPSWQAGSSSSLPAWGAQLEDVSFLPWSQPVLAVLPAWTPLLSVRTGGGGELGPMPPSRKSEDPVSPLVNDPIVQQPFLFLHLGWVWAPQLTPRDQYPTWQAKIRDSFAACCPQPPFFLTLPSSPLLLWTSGDSFSPRLTFCYSWPLCCLGSTADGHKDRW